MTPRKPRTRAPHNNPNASEYDSDLALPQTPSSAPPPPTRSNAELNLSVVRRHSPTVDSILSIAPYAVVYLFSPSLQSWQKTGMEGTLFVCSHASDAALPSVERYSVFVLNRRGLDNFELELKDSGGVEVTDDYVILTTSGGGQGQAEEGGEGAHKVFGLWIFSEPEPSSTARTREINAGIIQDCAVQAEMSRTLAGERGSARH